MPTYEAIQIHISTQIVANYAGLISADVLRPVLNEILDYAHENIGSPPVYTKDADNNVFYNGVTATMGTGCTKNVFYQGAESNTLGENCTNNTFKQSVSGFTFGNNLQNVTIESGAVTGDYTTSPDYDFLYGNSYPATIFYDGSNNIHQYYDTSNKRYVLTNLSTLVTRFFYAGEFVPYTGATTDVDLDVFSLNAKSLHVKGTGGNGHLGLKHQSSGASAGGSESVLYADNSGNPTWKNAGAAVVRIVLDTELRDFAKTATSISGGSGFLRFDGVSYSWTAVAGGTAEGQVQYRNSTGGLAATDALTWQAATSRLLIGTGGTTGAIGNGLHIGINAGNSIGASIINYGTTNASTASLFIASGSSGNRYITFDAFSATAIGNHAGTDIPMASTVRLLSGSPLVHYATSSVFIAGSPTPTGYGIRHDTEGVRIDILANLHTANTVGRIFQAGNLQFTTGNVLNIANSSGVVQINGTQVIKSRIGAWAAPTGTATRTSFATGSVTLVQLAERVKALIDDLITHGLIGT